MSARMPCTARVGVELGDEVEHLGLGGVRGQRVVEVGETDRAGVLLDLAAVELRPAVVAHEDGGHARRDALRGERRDLGADLLADLSRRSPCRR